MKKVLFLVMLLGSTMTFANKVHNHNSEEQRVVYEVIKHQLDTGVITIKEAQKQWSDYIHCCKEKKK